MIQLTEEPISVAPVLESVTSAEAGAVVTFDGRVRNHSHGRRVEKLFYEAYAPMALRELEQIVAQAGEQWPVTAISVIHRIGELQIGQSSVFIAVSAAHRRHAFAACRYIIDTIKKSVPIWKKEFFADGEVWIEPHT